MASLVLKRVARAGAIEVEVKPADWRPPGAGRLPIRGSPTSMPPRVLGDPQPTPQRQNLLPGGKWVKDLGEWEKQISDCCTGVAQIGNPKTSR